MEKINIAELLKDCPSGMELYSPLCGICVFDHIDMGTIICKKQNTQEIAFTREGYYMLPVFDNCECMIFPSKDQRDWSKFQRPFKDGDIVVPYLGNIAIISNKTDNILYYTYCEFFEIKNNTFIKTNTVVYPKRLATEEEKQKLFKAIKENGYRWNEETKILELIKPNKEETTKEKLEQIIYDIPKGYEFFGINDDNEIVLTKKQIQYQIQYPKTYKSITIGKGNPEWGAPAEDVFIIKLGKRI